MTSSSGWLLPEIGYSWRPAAGGQNVHLGLLGVGGGYGDFNNALILYTPSFVAGTLSHETALGFRHGISVHVKWTLLSIELWHQVLSSSGRISQEIMAGLGVNPLGLFPLYRLLVH